MGPCCKTGSVYLDLAIREDLGHNGRLHDERPGAGRMPAGSAAIVARKVGRTGGRAGHRGYGGTIQPGPEMVARGPRWPEDRTGSGDRRS